MKLTKKEAIENHRKMWNWIAVMLKSERYKAFDYMEHGKRYGITITCLKEAYINMIGLKGEIYCDCFCCEYAFNSNLLRACDNCPVIWSYDRCDEVGCEYGQLFFLPYTPENLPKAVALALEIANLPERED